MPRRKSKTPRPKRRSTARLLTEMTGRSVLSPASSLVIGWNNLPEACKICAFTIAKVVITVSAVDTATANKQTFGSCLTQIRQLSPYAPSDAKSGNTIKSSKLGMSGPSPKTYYFRPLQVEYPESFKGDLLSIDCICPQESWEIGALTIFSITFNVKHKSTSEACKANFKIIKHSEVQTSTSSDGIAAQFDVLSLGSLPDDELNYAV